MATTYLALPNTKATGDALAATDWNKTTASVDRGAVFSYKQKMGGVLSGWVLTCGISTVTPGEGLVGPAWCVTAASQSISNLTAGSTNYVYAQTDAGAGSSGTVDFVARTTSGVLANHDAVTSALILGNGTFATGSGFTSVSTRNRDTFPLYRREETYYRAAGDLLLPSTAHAHGSTVQGSTVYTLLRFPNASTTKAFLPIPIRPDYTGTVTGVSNNIQLEVDAASRGNGDAWQAGYTATGAGGAKAISGTSGNVSVISGTWSSGLPTAGDNAVLRIARNGAHGSDAMTGDALLLGLGVEYDTQL